MIPKVKAEELIAHFSAIQIGKTTNGEPVYLGQNNPNEVKNCVYITILEIKRQADNWGIKSVHKYWDDVWEVIRHSSDLDISDVMFTFYENKYRMLPSENKYTDEDLIIKFFEAEFGNKPTTTKDRLYFANELSKKTGLLKTFILGIIKNRN